MVILEHMPRDIIGIKQSIRAIGKMNNTYLGGVLEW